MNNLLNICQNLQNLKSLVSKMYNLWRRFIIYLEFGKDE